MLVRVHMERFCVFEFQVDTTCNVNLGKFWPNFDGQNFTIWS